MVDHKETGTDDIKCTSKVIWDVVSSDENITIIMRLFSQSLVKKLTNRYNIKVLHGRVKETRLRVYMVVIFKVLHGQP